MKTTHDHDLVALRGGVMTVDEWSAGLKDGPAGLPARAAATSLIAALRSVRFRATLDLQLEPHIGTRNLRPRVSVLDCASPLALFDPPGLLKPKRQRTGAVQNLAALRRFMERVAPRPAPLTPSGPPVLLTPLLHPLAQATFKFTQQRLQLGGFFPFQLLCRAPGQAEHLLT